MDSYSSDESAFTALAFLELAEANISPASDERALAEAIDQLESSAETERADAIDELLDDATRAA